MLTEVYLCLALSPELQHVLRLMLAPDPRDRASVELLLSLPSVRKHRWRRQLSLRLREGWLSLLTLGQVNTSSVHVFKGRSISLSVNLYRSSVFEHWRVLLWFITEEKKSSPSVLWTCDIYRNNYNLVQIFSYLTVLYISIPVSLNNNFLMNHIKCTLFFTLFSVFVTLTRLCGNMFLSCSLSVCLSVNLFIPLPVCLPVSFQSLFIYLVGSLSNYFLLIISFSMSFLHSSACSRP